MKTKKGSLREDKELNLILEGRNPGTAFATAFVNYGASRATARQELRRVKMDANMKTEIPILSAVTSRIAPPILSDITFRVALPILSAVTLRVALPNKFQS